MLVAHQQIDIPFEGDAEPRIRLLLGRLAVAEVHGEVATLRQLAEDRRVVLNRMTDQEPDAHD